MRELMGFTTNAQMAFVANYDLSTLNHCTAPSTSDKFETVGRVLKIADQLGILAGAYSQKPSEKCLMTGDGHYVVFYDWPEKFEGLSVSLTQRFAQQNG